MNCARYDRQLLCMFRAFIYVKCAKLANRFLHYLVFLNVFSSTADRSQC